MLWVNSCAGVQILKGDQIQRVCVCVCLGREGTDTQRLWMPSVMDIIAGSHPSAGGPALVLLPRLHDTDRMCHHRYLEDPGAAQEFLHHFIHNTTRSILFKYILCIRFVCVCKRERGTYRSEGSEDFVEHLQQCFFSTGGDVVLRQLQKRQTIFTLTPHVLNTHKHRISSHTSYVQKFHCSINVHLRIQNQSVCKNSISKNPVKKAIIRYLDQWYKIKDADIFV